MTLFTDLVVRSNKTALESVYKGTGDLRKDESVKGENDMF